jgi:uncharacterized membrane protein YgdD (TMEM256/DUF423 family)
VRRWFMLGAALAALGVMAGAFGAHGLKERLEPAMLVNWETAARYQLFHALGLLGVAFAAREWPSRLVDAGGWLLLAGTVVFSGTLYAMALTGVRILGAITPLGGLCLVAGWACLALSASRGGGRG